MVITIYNSLGTPKAELSPNDSSTHVKEVQGDNVLTLSFTHYDHIALDVDDYIDFEGERFWLTEKYRPKQNARKEWVYDVKFYGVESMLKRLLVIRSVDGEDDPVFTLTAPPREHVAMIVRCMNNGLGNITDWKAGQVDGTENIVIDYFGKYCDEALKEIAEKVGAEAWVEGETVNICKCEHGEPITMGYDKGLLSIDPGTADNVKFYTRLYPVGSSRNIDREKYGYSRLQLPGGKKYVEINADKYGRVDHYEADAFADIYPRRTGSVSDVRSEVKTGEDGNPFTIYYFSDNSLPFDPNAYEIGGLVKRVSFQEGSELAGLGEEDNGTYYFEVNFNSSTMEFEIITIWPYEDGMQLPGDKLVPKAGDKYILWNIGMPDEYYTLAEAEFMEAVDKYNAEHNLDIAVYKGPTDHVWIEDNGVELTIGQRVRLESYEYFPETGYRDSRITKITRKVNLPSSMDIEISDALSRTAQEKMADSIDDVRSYARSIGESVSLPDIIRSGDRTVATDNNLYSARRSQREFLGKKGPDRTPYMLASDEGFDIGDFLAGVSGARIAKDKETGRTYGELDELYVRVKAYFESLTVIEREALAGEQQVTPGGGVKCTSVVAVDAEGNELTDINSPSAMVYRCFFLSEQDGEKRETFIKAGDQVIAQEWNAKEGTDNKARNRRWWRLVTAVNQDALTDEVGNHYGYIEVSKADCEVNSNIPEAGDDMVQFGNREDATRQTAIVISTVSPADAPSMKLFTGIGSGATNAEHYSLDERDIIGYGYDRAKGRAYMRCYGDFFYGDKDGKTWIKYDAGEKTLEAKLRLHLESTIGDQTLNEYFQGLLPEDKPSYVEEALHQYSEIDGGLFITSFITAGYTDNNGLRHNLAGMNGIRETDKSPFLWGGGSMIDRFYDAEGKPCTTPLASGYANALIRMDGSAYFGGGAHAFNADGTGWLGGEDGIRFAGGAMTFGSGIRIDLGEGKDTTLGGIQSTLESVLNFMQGLGEVFIPEDAQGNRVAWNSTALSRVKSVKGFYSEEFISARGLNPWQNIGAVGATALSGLTDVELSNPQDGQALVYNGGKWVNRPVSAGSVGLDETQLAQYLTQNNYLQSSALDGYALKSELVTTAERTLWNQTATNLSAILGSDASGVIDKWDEIVAFLATYTEADTLANLLSNKADKTTKISAGPGLTGGGSLASDRTLSLAASGVTAGTYTKLTVDAYGRATGGATLVASDIPTLAISKIDGLQSALDAKVAKAGDTMTGLLTLNAGAKVASGQKLTIGDCEITWDADKGGLKFNKGIYSESFVSARGVNSSGGSGGGLIQKVYGIGSLGGTFSDSTLTDTFNAYTINQLYQNKADKSWVEAKGYLTASALSAYLKIDGSNGTHAGVTALVKTLADATGVVTDVTKFVTSDNVGDSGAYLYYRRPATSLWNYIKGKSDATYLPLTGGTLKNGDAAGPLNITTDSTAEVGIRFNMPAGNKGWVGYHPTYGTNLYNYAKGWSLGLKDDGGLYYNGGTIWHSGNDGAGSGLDADLLDGVHASSFEGYYKTIIDASSLDNNTWYPVIMSIGNSMQTRIRVEGRTETKASWNSRADNTMAVILDYIVNGSGWGFTPVLRTINSYMLGAGAGGSNCVAGLGQLMNSSIEYVFVRGGAKYDFYLSRAITPILFTTVYTINYESISPTTISPPYISRNNALITDNVASASRLQGSSTYSAWGQTFWQNGVPNSVSGIFSTIQDVRIDTSSAYFQADNGTWKLALGIGISGNAGLLQRTRDAWILGYNDSTTHTWLGTIGNVGIGTSTPAYKLDVNGLVGITANGLTLKLGAQNAGFIHIYTSDTTKPFAINPSGVAMVGNGTLGTSGYRAGNVYSVLGNFSGKVTAQSLQIGDCTITYENGGLRFSSGIYSDSFVSARGLNSSGGSGGTSYNRLDNWADYATSKDGYVLSAKLGWELYQSKADKSWVEAKGYLTASALSAYLKIDGSNGTHAGVTALVKTLADATGVVTDVTKFVTSDNVGDSGAYLYYRRPATSLWNYIKGKSDATYLPLTGGTLKNGDAVGPLNITTDSTAEVGIRFNMPAGNKGWVGYHPTYGTNLYNYAKGWSLGLKDDGGLYYNGGTIWHSGNDGAGSGLDADLLDGVHASSFVDRRVGYGDDNLAILKALHPSLADSDAHTVRLQRSSHSMAFGWFLKGYALANAYGGWFVSDYGTPRWIGVDNGDWKSETFAFLSSNVASASKLQTARTIWGQSFNGEGNVSGSLTLGSGNSIIGGNSVPILQDHGNKNVTLSASKGDLYIGFCYTGNVRFYSGSVNGTGTQKAILLSNGNFGINTDTPSYPLDVNGDARINGNLDVSAKLDVLYELYVAGETTIDAATEVNSTLYVDDYLECNSHIRCTGLAGSSWGNGSGAYNVRIQNNNNQTPLLLAYRSGSTTNATGADRLFSMELLNSGDNLRFYYKGTMEYEFSSGGVFHSVGGVYSDGYVSARGQNTSSDARLKCNLNPFEITVRKIADAPSVSFHWRAGGRDLGSVAQYWREISPLLTPESPDGYLTLQYGKTALLSVIAVARSQMRLEDEVRGLRRRVEELEMEKQKRS